MEFKQTPSPAVALFADALVSDLVVVDVGCSGGVSSGWRSFGDRLTAVGFDIASGEVARLNAAESNPKVRYFAAQIGLPSDHPLAMAREAAGYWRRNPWNNLAVFLAQDSGVGRPGARSLARTPSGCAATGGSSGRALARGPARLEGSGGSARSPQFRKRGRRRRRGADAAESLAGGSDRGRFARGAGTGDRLRRADAGGLDVDGAEYELLFSIQDRLGPLGVLGVAVEVNFFGGDGPHHHTFHNVDRLLRAQGFTLFALTTRPYSAAALPAPFAGPHPTRSVSGRPLQGDALYMRDPQMGEAAFSGTTMSGDQLLKLAALFTLFDLRDQAADVLLRGRDRLSRAGFEVGAALDLLAREVQGDRAEPWSYDDYLAAFRRGDPWFFRPWPGDPPAQPAEPAALEAEMRSLSTRLAVLRASRIWRWTGPLRSIGRRLSAGRSGASG